MRDESFAGGAPGPRNLHEEVLTLLAPLVPGRELEGLRFARISTELGVRLTFRDAAGVPLHVELERRRPEGKYAATTERLGFAYRAGPLGDRGRGMCEVLARHVAPNEARFLERAAALAGGDGRIREVRVDQLLEPMGEGAFDGLSPYVGCVVGCRFCYAQTRLHALRSLLGRADVPWGSWVDARVNAAEVLAHELAGRDPERPIKFCPVVSDPYQALERRYRITRACLEVLRDAPTTPPVLVLSRTVGARDDLPLLAAAGAMLGVSLPTLDDDVRAHFEPRGAPIADRLALLRDAQAAGIATFAVAQPMLPGPVERLADALAAYAQSVSLDVLHGEQGASDDFADPRYAMSRTDEWQAERAATLGAALEARGVPVWTGELPPSLAQPAGSGADR